MSDGTRPREEVGSLADEAAKLFAAATEWAREHTGERGAASHAHSGGDHPGGPAGHIATGAPECRWCPICQAIGVLRSTSPEVKEHVASLVVAARQVLDAVADSLAEPTGADGRRERGARTPDVEHIDLGEGEPWD